MGPWETYRSRIDSRGGTKREMRAFRGMRYLAGKYKDSLAYQTMEIDGVMRNEIGRAHV